MDTDERQTSGERMPQAEASTMRAVVQHRYGPPDVLGLADVALPAPGPRDVLVRVEAASVHPGDYFVVTGTPYIVRLAFGLRRPRHGIPGRDLAGVVVAAGADVADVRVGERVFGWSAEGALAEFARVPARTLAPTPDDLTAEQAAAVPTSAVTALQALRDVGRVRAGQRVLITGASGGVGTFAVQIAKALGAEVTAVCSARNADLVRSLGADHVVDYATTDFTRTGERYDVILDTVEATSLTAVRRALATAGTLVPISGRGGRWIGPLGRVVRTRLLSAFTRQRLRPFTSVGRRADLLALAELLGNGQISPVIDRSFALADAADALRFVGAGHTQGKVVITL